MTDKKEIKLFKYVYVSFFLLYPTHKRWKVERERAKAHENESKNNFNNKPDFLAYCEKITFKIYDISSLFKFITCVYEYAHIFVIFSLKLDKGRKVVCDIVKDWEESLVINFVLSSTHTPFEALHLSSYINIMCLCS